MPTPPFYVDLESWAMKKGAPIKRKGPPGHPMKASTVRYHMIRIKRILTLTDPPFLEVVGQDGKAFIYKAGEDSEGNRMNIRRIRPEHLAGALEAMFPEGVTREVAQDHAKNVQSCILLGRWLAYELKEGARYCWSERDLKALRELTPTRRFKAEKLRVIDPERFDRFLLWEKVHHPEHWAALWAMRFIGLRYSGMVGAERSLRKKAPHNTFRVMGGEWTIWEKVYPRSFPLPDHIKSFLDYWKVKLEELHPEAETFFVNTKGTPWSWMPGAFNKMFRKHWVEWTEDVEDEDLEDEDLELCHAHMCRHVCATDLAMRNVPAAVIQEYMGHQDLRTTQQYINLVASKQKVLIDDAFQDLNGVVP